MSLLHTLGVLSTAQDLTAGSTASENVIDMGVLGINGFGPGDSMPYLDLETETIAAGDGSDTYEFTLMVGDAVDNGKLDLNGNLLDTGLHVLITGVTDTRLATAGKKIITCQLPDQIRQLARTGYRYLGIKSDISSGATISINAAVTPGRPRTEDNVQVTTSPVGLPSGA